MKWTLLIKLVELMYYPLRERAMGHVILPSGSSVWVEELKGSINLSQLVSDMKCEDYTASYRITIIAALGKLGKNAASALPYLKELAEIKNAFGNEKLLVEASEQAIKKIDGDTSSNVAGKNNDWSSYERNHTYNGHGGSNANATTRTYTGKKLEVHKVTFTEIDTEGSLHDGLKVYCRCNFCEKMSVLNPHSKKFSDRLAGADKYFCNFCIRNDYYQRYSNNIMVLTYRGLIGYYYYAYYVVPKTPSMYLVDVQDYVELHIKAGLQNPIFRYDPETFCWFIDFSKVGKTKKKMPVETVLNTIIEQLACFNIYENVRDSSPRKLYQKYHQAVMDFYQNRTRFNGDRVFAPTLWGCDIPTRCTSEIRAIPVDMLQNFAPANLVDHTFNNRHAVKRLL